LEKRIEPAPKIVALNKLLQDYAFKNNHIYLDYFTAVVDNRNGFRKELANDGVHPNIEGYKIMVPLVEEAISKALNN